MLDKRVLLYAACLLLTSRVPAQTVAKSSTPAQQPSRFAHFIDGATHPTEWLTWGADFRVRNEYFNEIITLSESDPLHEQDVVRFRGRLWATGTVLTNLTLNTRLSAEPRLWNKKSFAGAYGDQTGTEWRYGIFDIVTAKWANILEQPLTLTAGRQDILLGDYYDWWLVADGTPGDGSWTFFLDSLRLAWEPEPLNTRFDLIYIHQNSRADEWIPTLNDSDNYPLTDQQERGVIVYASNKSIENVQVDTYFMYKHDDRETFTINGRDRVPGDNADIYTLGGKVTGTAAEHWRYSLEGAYQFGQKEDMILGADRTRDIDAYGAKAKLSYLLKDRMKNEFSLSGEFLSGDDPDTDEDEMFDVLWGRWPRWSELYIYSYIMETSGRVGQLNNIARFGPSWSITPAKGLTFSAAYNVFLAPEETPTRALNPGLFSRDGHFRGHYAQAVFKYQFNKYVNAHLWGEGVWQGDFYASRDLLSFLRAEIMVTF